MSVPSPSSSSVRPFVRPVVVARPLAVRAVVVDVVVRPLSVRPSRRPLAVVRHGSVA